MSSRSNGKHKAEALSTVDAKAERYDFNKFLLHGIDFKVSNASRYSSGSEIARTT